MSDRPLERAVVLDALEAEAGALVAATVGLSADAFARPTPCEPWSVKELLAHLLIASSRLPGMLAEPAPAQADASALEYFRRDRYGGDLDEERVEDARVRAADFASGRALVEATSHGVDEMIRRSHAETYERRIRTRWGDEMRLTEYLGTRVFELAVHGLDLASALERDPWISGPGLAVVVSVLAPLVAADQLRNLGWDELTFVARTTGRLAVMRDERWVAPQLLWPRVAAG